MEKFSVIDKNIKSNINLDVSYQDILKEYEAELLKSLQEEE